MAHTNVLALSGSLRHASINTAVLRATARMAPANMMVALYRGIGELPLFNPDIEADPPAPVVDLRDRILATDALLIASPEYAHGVTGIMKNALDWMVGNETFVDRPIALLNTSPRATHAQAALREIVTTMSARIIEDACVTLPLLGAAMSEDDMVAHPAIRRSILASLASLEQAVHCGASGG